VPFVHVVGIVGALLCVFIMKGLPIMAWQLFGIWLLIGLVLYFAFGFWNSKLRTTNNSQRTTNN
jgi:APA family basic amino acid/polyamine antiporter